MSFIYYVILIISLIIGWFYIPIINDRLIRFIYIFLIGPMLIWISTFIDEKIPKILLIICGAFIITHNFGKWSRIYFQCGPELTHPASWS